MLNEPGGSSATVVAELERAAITDPRVDPATVKAIYHRETERYGCMATNDDKQSTSNRIYIIS